MTDLTDLTAEELLDGYRDGAWTPIDVVDACLSRMDELDTTLHAMVARCDAPARAVARRSTERWRDGSPGPLEGLPLGVKDIIDADGMATRAGSPLFADHVPSGSATAVDRLEAAGAIVLGKTTTPELAFGDQMGEPARNPWALDRWSGGSSSGSAVAVAARLFPAAVGTDTGGSIRVPTSYCGCSGLKPTFGRVPRDGVFPVSWTLDHTGPMARSVADLGLLLTVIAGRSGGDPYSSPRPVPDYRAAMTSPIEGMVIGIPDGWLADGCSRGVIDARDAAIDVLSDLGARVVPMSVPHAELAATIAWLITVVEFASHHDGRLDRLEDFTPSAAQRLAAGARTSALDYLKALRARRTVQADFDAVFDAVDVVLTPATPTAAPVPAEFFDDGDRLWLDKVARNFLVFNVTGMPALVVPAGFDEGLPVAIQIAAPPHSDALCLQVGAAFQSATDHHRRAPSPQNTG